MNSIAIFQVLAVVLLSSSAFAAPNSCWSQAKSYFQAIKADVGSRIITDVISIENTPSLQRFAVTYSNPGKIDSISYEITIKRNASLIEANQTCERLLKLELVSEE